MCEIFPIPPKPMLVNKETFEDWIKNNQYFPSNPNAANKPIIVDGKIFISDNDFIENPDLVRCFVEGIQNGIKYINKGDELRNSIFNKNSDIVRKHFSTLSCTTGKIINNLHSSQSQTWFYSYASKLLATGNRTTHKTFYIKNKIFDIKNICKINIYLVPMHLDDVEVVFYCPSCKEVYYVSLIDLYNLYSVKIISISAQASILSGSIGIYDWHKQHDSCKISQSIGFFLNNVYEDNPVNLGNNKKFLSIYNDLFFSKEQIYNSFACGIDEDKISYNDVMLTLIKETSFKSRIYHNNGFYYTDHLPNNLYNNAELQKSGNYYVKLIIPKRSIKNIIEKNKLMEFKTANFEIKLSSDEYIKDVMEINNFFGCQ